MNGKIIKTYHIDRPGDYSICGDKCIVHTNIRQEDGMWVANSIYMTPAEFAAYLGAKSVAIKRESEIYDDTIAELIDEGVL